MTDANGMNGGAGLRIAIVGASGGIGSALAMLARGKGHRVAVLSRNAARVQEVASQCEAASIVLESGDFSGIERGIGAAAEAMGGIDAAVCCAGTFLLKPAHLTSEAELRGILDSQVVSAFATVRAAARLMMDGGNGGGITLVSSAAARIGLVNHEAISVAKGAIDGLVLSAAATYSRYRVRVNAVAPGLVATPMTARITGNAAALEASQAMHPLGRIGAPDDIAQAILFSISTEASWMTGQIIAVDGGLSAVKVPAAAKKA